MGSPTPPPEPPIMGPPMPPAPGSPAIRLELSGRVNSDEDALIIKKAVQDAVKSFPSMRIVMQIIG